MSHHSRRRGRRSRCRRVHRGRVHWARALETPTFLPVQSPARTPIRSAGYWRGARMSACGARRAPVPPPLPSAVPSRPIGHFRLSSLPCPSPSTPLATFRPSIPSASALVVAVNPLHFFPRRARPSSEARAIPTRPRAPVRPVLRSPPHARVRRSPPSCPPPISPIVPPPPSLPESPSRPLWVGVHAVRVSPFPKTRKKESLQKGA